jgi:maltokinase
MTLGELVDAYAARHASSHDGAGSTRVVDSEVLARGRPGIIDVVAERDDTILHLPVGLRVPGEEGRYLPEVEDPVLGLFEDEQGVAVATEAIRDAELSVLLLEVVTGQRVDPGSVRQLRIDGGSVTLAMAESLAFTVFTELAPGPRPGLEMLSGLDSVGFNHIAAPVALWRRGGLDLGVVQEYLAGASMGWRLAETSVRDLYASGGPPELAGADFATEAERLGTMTARMHLALEQAFGRAHGDVSAWADAVEAVVKPLAPRLLERPEVVELLEDLRALDVPCPAIRTHGDYDLGRVFRTEQGWYVGDLDPGGRPLMVAGTVAEGDPPFRSPLADVADMLWSFGHIASTAAQRRDPSGQSELMELADAWTERNRRFFLACYAAVPGIERLVPGGAETARVLSSAFELERAALELADADRTGADRP